MIYIIAQHVWMVISSITIIILIIPVTVKTVDHVHGSWITVQLVQVPMPVKLVLIRVMHYLRIIGVIRVLDGWRTASIAATTPHVRDVGVGRFFSMADASPASCSYPTALFAQVPLSASDAKLAIKSILLQAIASRAHFSSPTAHCAQV